MVAEEIARLTAAWREATTDEDGRVVREVLRDKAAEIDPFDTVQLANVIRTCRQSSSLSDAGRKLFAVSRAQRTSRNDADRLRKYLAKFGLDWSDVQRSVGGNSLGQL